MRSWLWNKKLPRSKKATAINNDSSETGKDTKDLEIMQSEQIINSSNPTTIEVKVQRIDADGQSDTEISNEDDIYVEQEDIEGSFQKGIDMNKAEEEQEKGEFLWSMESSEVLENFRMSLVNDTEDA